MLEHRHQEHRPLSEFYRSWWILDETRSGSCSSTVTDCDKAP